MIAEKKIVLVTGANKGIGFATARHLAGAGHTVLIGSRDPARGAVAAAELVGEGLDVRVVPLDVTDPETIATAAAFIDAEYGRLDVLVNNAGISLDRPYTPLDVPVEAMREIFETNVFGVVAVTNGMLPLLRKSTAAIIGNVSSGLGTVAFLADPTGPGAENARFLSYNSSKAALNAITMMYAHALRAEGIAVNALTPGFCATDLTGHAGFRSADDGGADIARLVLSAPPGTTGVLFGEDGTIRPW